MLAFYRANVGVGRPPKVRDALLEDAIANAAPRARESFATMCEVAQRFAGWLDLGPGVQAALEYVFARWDGRGFPDAAGDASRSRCVSSTWRGTSRSSSPPSGADEARDVVERRAGTAYEPRLAELAAANFDELLAELDETRMWEQALESEPFPKLWIAGERVDAAFMAIAALTGLKSPWLREHSTGVADLAEAAAWRMGLPAASVTLLRRAALAHDLGRVGVSNAIWEKPGPLGFGEWERVRLHPHFTERAFAQSPALAPVGLLAGSHHERLDGSGYHRGTRGPALDQAARILAAADCYAAMREARPHRPALEAPAAEAELMREAEEGRLDPDAVDAVLAAAGHRVRAATSRAPCRTDRSASSRSSSCSCAASPTRRSPRISASRPRPSGTTSSTSTRRPASAAGRLRRSGHTRTTSFAAHRAFARCRRGFFGADSPHHRRRVAAPETQRRRR